MYTSKTPDCIELHLTSDDVVEETEQGGDEDPREDDGVVVLTDSNFEKYQEEQEVMLAEFYAPW